MTDPRILPDEELARYKVDAEKFDALLNGRPNRILLLLEHGKALADRADREKARADAAVQEAATHKDVADSMSAKWQEELRRAASKQATTSRSTRRSHE